jgi:DinB family protein
MSVNPGRPQSGEFLEYYGRYINLVPQGDITSLLEQQIDETVETLSTFSDEQAAWRPAPGEWNVIEIVGHLADMERVFAYRAVSFARKSPGALPDIDPDDFMAEAGFARRPLADVVAEFVAVRQATMTLFRSLDEAAWLRRGVASDNEVSVRALAYISAGHELHHSLDFPKHRAMRA